MRSLFAWAGVLTLAVALTACGGGGSGGGGGGGTTTVVSNPSSITSRSTIPATDPRCLDVGGVEIFYGIDDNANGVLDVGERDGSEVICNGARGTNGTIAAWELLADRVSFLQVDYGTWEFTAFDVHSTFDPTTPGLQSMAGRTAMGLFDAYARKPKLLWKGTLDATKNYLMDFMAYYVANGNPGPTTGTGLVTDSYNVSTANNSLSNFSFLKRYKDTFGLSAAEWTTVNEALTRMLTDYNATEGTDITVTIDGILNHIVTSRAGNPGLGPWDTARVLQVAVEFGLAPAETAFAVAFQKALMDSNGDGTIDFDETQFGGYLGVASSLDSLLIASDTSLKTALVAKLNSGFSSAGNIVSLGAGSDASDDVQDSAYALLAIKRAGETAQAAATQAWLEAQVDSSGRIWFPQVFDWEWAVLDGEVLAAILR